MIDKQHILREIRRTALDNGGLALGKRTFFKETGIKESDRAGRIWPRWSAAVAEAGFAPLTRTPITDRRPALSKIVTLTRRLGKLPTVAEMQLEKRSDPQFPGVSALHRTTSRNKLHQDLVEYCNSHKSNEDVAQILAKFIPSAYEAQQEDSQMGTVYLIHAGSHYKIGITTALYRRASQIANGNPHGAELIHSFETDDPRGIEAYWHNRFADKRVKGKNIESGEWFTLAKSDIAAFCKRKKFM